MTWYKTGTISLTNGSAAVTGAGTSWVDAGVLNAGDILAPPDGNLYEILSIQSNTGLTLASNYLGTTAAGAAYALIPIGLLPSALAQQVKAVLVIAAAANSAAVLTTAAQGLTSTQQGNARTNIAALGAADVGAGRLSKSVAGGADVTLTATEAAAQIIECTGTLTANINLIVPAAARLFAIFNNTSGAYTLTVKTAAGTGVAVPQGLRGIVECDATNVVGLTVGAPGSVTTLAASGATTLGGTLSVGGGTLGANQKVRVKGATNQNLMIGPTSGVANSVVLATLNDADTENIPLEIRASKTVFQIGNIESPNSISLTGASSTLGYGTGSGGTVTQATSKSTGVTLNRASGQITMHNEALAAGTAVSFQFANSLITPSSVVIANVQWNSVANPASYSVRTAPYVDAGTILMVVKNETGSSASDAIVINFEIFTGATA